MSKKIPSRISIVNVKAEGTTSLRPHGIEYHPVHRQVLSDHAQVWMPEVIEFYESRLVGVDLAASEASCD